ncbi:carboxylate-amine ligase [Prauserella alba]|uniref:Putative glutamate--cysteine ligase 2 n=1 Tax=Prauserella alba TaxID=176898 RepID=A0ABN1V3J6_9PSEU|nr:glutamate--cysteine ligase [Prauserella alba]MCP2180306.1 carboxylate-amine ligase [Prauserella alba]
MSAARTVGIEEEFLLVDPDTWHTVPAADDVLARLPDAPSDKDGPGITDDEVRDPAWHGELRASQVEAATGVCTTASALRRQLLAGRYGLATAARAEGLALVASGNPALASAGVPLGSDPQYTELDGLYRGLIGDYEGCGCHVHVGVPDREAAVVAVNHLRPWLPTLLALSANSPYDRGHDTGYASWRTVQHSRFPTAGVPPRFADVAEHDAVVDRLVTSGALGAQYTTFWFARPSPVLPTVEVRIADTATTPDEALLQALLCRALVDTALGAPSPGDAADRDGADVAEPIAEVLPAAVWSAARYGLAGRGVDPWTGRTRPAAELVDDLLDHVRPALERSGDADLVDSLARHLVADGSGAQRQRRAAAHGIRHAVRAVADDTIRDLPE